MEGVFEPGRNNRKEFFSSSETRELRKDLFWRSCSPEGISGRNLAHRNCLNWSSKLLTSATKFVHISAWSSSDHCWGHNYLAGDTTIFLNLKDFGQFKRDFTHWIGWRAWTTRMQASFSHNSRKTRSGRNSGSNSEVFEENSA